MVLLSALKPACFSPMILSACDLQHDFASVTDEADRSVVLALLQVAFLITKDWVHGVGHSPMCQNLLQIVVRVVITSSPHARPSSAGMLSTPADFPSSMIVLQPPLVCKFGPAKNNETQILRKMFLCLLSFVRLNS